MAANATGAFFGIKHAIPAMIANGGGSIHPGIMPPMRASGRTADPVERMRFIPSAGRERSMKSPTPSCSSRQMKLPTLPVRKCTSTRALAI
jgi:hypothetical protein